MFSLGDPDKLPSDSVVLNTDEEGKLLFLTPEPHIPNIPDFQFSLRAQSPTVSAIAAFQLSESQLRAFFAGIDGIDGAVQLLQDENGHGSITFERVDRIGHFRVIIQTGGPWSDHAEIIFATDQAAVSSFLEALHRACTDASGDFSLRMVPNPEDPHVFHSHFGGPAHQAALSSAQLNSGAGEGSETAPDPRSDEPRQIALEVVYPDERPCVDVHYEMWGQYALWLSGRYGFGCVSGSELGLSPTLVQDLDDWTTAFDRLVDQWDPRDSRDLEGHNEAELPLALRVRAELPPEWIVSSGGYTLPLATDP